jgi:hypothetical protein
MKIRKNFVSNSSSTSFILTNLTKVPLTLRDFISENAHLVEKFNQEYDDIYTVDDLLRSCGNEALKPGDTSMEFGDHEGPYGHTPLGNVYDYILRDGGKSERFEWRFDHYNR